MTQLYFLTTRRLGIRIANTADSGFIHGLWTMPDVMRFVGFPKGLAISVDDVCSAIERNTPSGFGSLLIAATLDTDQLIGQCKTGTPDAEGICEPDIKLLPSCWRNGYGHELWAAMVDYAFTNPAVRIIQGTPNRANTASIRMQLGCGMIQVDEGVFDAHVALHPEAIPVPYLKLQITREQWILRSQTALPD